MDSFGIAEAVGKATAAVCIQGAIVSLLVRKRLIEPADAATLAGEAETVLLSMAGLSEESRVMAQAALKGFSTAWTKVVTKN